MTRIWTLLNLSFLDLPALIPVNYTKICSMINLPKMKKTSLILIGFIFWLNQSFSQNPVSVPFDSESWNTENTQSFLTNYLGKKCILVNGGKLFLKDVEFVNGVVEVDINFSNRRNFPSVDFRIQDPQNYEHFYVRPHQSGNPDANQYTPVFNGLAGWQLYYGDQYATPIKYGFGEWHHIKIVVSGSKADIYFDDMENAILKVKELKHGVSSGTLGLGGGFGAVYFANFQYTLTDGPTSAEPLEPTTDETFVTTWEISDTVTDDFLDNSLHMKKDITSSFKWKEGLSEASGLLNLAKYSRRLDGKNTVIAKVEIEAQRSVTKVLHFGFSDRVVVFVNGQPIFAGNDQFVSRDYRFLGTIGFYDSVFLPLKKGENEVWFVVSENFGGWGVQAKFDNIEGIKF